MPRELVNANITHVSYVDKGANQKPFFFTKSDKQPDFKKEVKVFVNKDDEEQQLVYGVVYEPEVEDSHGDYMTAPEIEKSAHGFMKDARNIDTQHDFEAGVGEVVESYIAPADLSIGDHSITKGSWVLVTKANDDIWQDIKKGSITGYSMAGTAETIEKAENEKPVSKSENDEEMKGFFNLLKSFFTKGELRDRYENNQPRRNLWAVWDGLESTFHESLWENRTPEATDFDRLITAVDEFREILQEIRESGDIQKALENKPESIGKGEDEMKAEDFAKILDEKLSPIVKRLEDVEKEEEVQSTEETQEDGDLVKQLSAVIDEKLASVAKRLETVEKARGTSQQADVDDVDVNKSEQQGYMRHFG